MNTESTTFKMPLKELNQVLGFRASAYTLRFLSNLCRHSLIETRLAKDSKEIGERLTQDWREIDSRLAKDWVILECPILLDLKAKDFNRSRASRNVVAPKSQSYSQSKSQSQNKGCKKRKANASKELAPAKADADQKESIGKKTWEFYSNAFFTRYGTEPVRNAKVNGQIKQLVQRLGADNAPFVAEFYVGHNNSFYVQKMHSVNFLLSDAEKLHAEWKTGNKVTTTKARETEKLDAFAEQHKRIQRGEL